MRAEPAVAAGETPVQRYKSLLRAYIDRRPSGVRGRLARALGKHKSFITQITSPAYAAPIPAADIPTIIGVCHLSSEERTAFLDAYRDAHPTRARRAEIAANVAHEVKIALPTFRSEATARNVEALIVDFAARTIKLAQQAEALQGERQRNKGEQQG